MELFGYVFILGFLLFFGGITILSIRVATWIVEKVEE